MLSDSEVDRRFWAEALSTCVYVRNRCPTSTLQDETPYTALYQRKPDVSHLRVFGTVCYVHIPKDERDKLSSKSQKCIFLGYCDNRKGYKLYNLATKKIVVSRDVVFNESEKNDHADEDVTSFERENYAQYEPLVSDTNEVENEIPPVIPNASSRPLRNRRAPNRFGEWTSICSEYPDPKSVDEAMDSPESEKWLQAMKKEMSSINENDVWDLVPAPTSSNIVGSKWVFKKKIGPNGDVESYKARLVAQGFSQKCGYDFDETYSPVVRFESIRAILSTSAEKGLHVHQMDVSSAFLNGDLKENIYMKQPDGFITPGKEDLVCKLKKSLYGLKQAPRCWNDAIDIFIKKLSFVQSESDPCVYIRCKNNDLCIIALYVDDIIVASKSSSQLEIVKSCLSERFKMKDLGRIKHFLGINIVQSSDNNVISIDQTSYVKNILNKFNLDNVNPVKTPIDISSKLDCNDDNAKLFDEKMYQMAVGCLLYLSSRTRPDIAHAVGMIARYSSKPTVQHWTAVKRIFRYLKGSINFGLVYSKNKATECIGYSDADWAGDARDRKSTSGYCFYMNGALISWRSSKQPCVALSTAESEYVALSAATQEAIWLNRLLIDIYAKSNLPIIIHEDNQAAMCIAKNPTQHPKTKHISIKFHFIREHIEQNDIILKYCNTKFMLADILTKGLSGDQFERIRDMLGVQNV